jgi:hypothetical protein
MMEWRTVLELIFSALVVLAILHLMARSVNRSRAKLFARARAAVVPPAPVVAPSPVAAPIPAPVSIAEGGPISPPPVVAPAPDKATIEPAATDNVMAPAAEPFMPEPVYEVATDTPAVPAASKTIAGPRKILVAASRPKRAVRAKAPILSKVKLAKPKHRPKRPDVASDQRPPRAAFVALTKAKSAVSHRPKRPPQIRRRKKMPAIAAIRASKVPLENSSRAP